MLSNLANYLMGRNAPQDSHKDDSSNTLAKMSMFRQMEVENEWVLIEQDGMYNLLVLIIYSNNGYINITERNSQ